MRRVIFLLALLGCLLYLGWYHIGQNIGNLPALSVVPADAVYILQADDPLETWQEIKRSPLWQHLRKQPYFAALAQGAQALDSLMEQNRRIFQLIASRTVLISAHVYQPLAWDFLFIVDLESAGRIAFLQDYLVGLPFSGLNLSKHEFEGMPIYQFYDRTSGRALYTAFVENLWLCSFQKTLVEKALAQRSGPTLLEKKQFASIVDRTSSKGLLQLFFNYAYLDELVNCYMPAGEWIGSLSKELAFTGGNFYLLDNQHLQIKGLTNLPDSVHSYYRAVLQAGQARMSVHQVLPQRTAAYLTLTCKDFQAFYQSFEEKYKQDPLTWSNYRKTIEQIERFLKISFRESFIDWIGEEIAIAQLLPESNRSEKDYAVFIKAKNASLGQEKLSFVAEQIRRRTPLKFIHIQYNGYPIYYLTIKFFFRLFLEKLFYKIDRPYFTYLEDYVVFSNHPQTLKNIIDDYVAGRTLANQVGFEQLLEQFSVASSVFMYVQMPALLPSMRSMVAPSTWQQINHNKPYITCFEHIGLQLISDGENFDTQLIALFNPQAREMPVFSTLYPWQDSASDLPEESIIIADINPTLQVEYYPNGTKKREVETRDGFRHGYYREYHPNGRLKVRGRYQNDQPEGIWRYYDAQGREIAVKRFEHGVEKQQ
ncbi:MAG: DUF3352 domain-containing protein [Cytophagales bacterium]|nr:DUF3352 domain-containing protein [Bernardetiaceae bacterium]MDW8211697.1 DUF3352 domain-containing protein [Cytophagales bacterium]